MKLDRSLIKHQAKELIKGQVLSLFIVTIVVGILCSFGTTVSEAYSAIKNDTPVQDYFYGDFFDNFGNNQQGGSSNNNNFFDRGYFDDFTGKVTTVSKNNYFNFNTPFGNDIIENILDLLDLVSFFMVPLSITLAGIYLALIRGQSMNTEQRFGYVFKNTFNGTYWRKLGLQIVQWIIIMFMFCLFIIPGIIYIYKYYFASTIMADNPNIKIGQALKISKKMTDGHKGELFALDLSFIGWGILTLLTAGILSIYVTPYYMTAKTLYYENFRIRCLQEGRITELDYMTDAQKAEFFYNTQTNAQYQQDGQQSYYQPFKNEQTQYYQAPQNEQPQYYIPTSPQAPHDPESPFGTGQDNNYFNGNC